MTSTRVSGGEARPYSHADKRKPMAILHLGRGRDSTDVEQPTASAVSALDAKRTSTERSKPAPQYSFGSKAVRIQRVGKSPSSPTHATYNICVDPYTGELRTLRRGKEIAAEPITDLVPVLPTFRDMTLTAAKGASDGAEADLGAGRRRPKAILHLARRKDGPYEEPSAVLPVVTMEKTRVEMKAVRGVKSSRVGGRVPTSPTHAAYHLNADPYAGELHDLGRREEITREPIAKFVPILPRPLREATGTEVLSERAGAEFDRRRPMAILHLGRSSPDEEPSTVSPVGGKKARGQKRAAKIGSSPSSPTHAAYHLSADPYTGALHDLGRREEIAAEPITKFVPILPRPPREMTAAKMEVARTEVDLHGDRRRPMGILHLTAKRRDIPDEEPSTTLPISGKRTTKLRAGKQHKPPTPQYPFEAEPSGAAQHSALDREKDIGAEPIGIHAKYTSVSIKREEVSSKGKVTKRPAVATADEPAKPKSPQTVATLYLKSPPPVEVPWSSETADRGPTGPMSKDSPVVNPSARYASLTEPYTGELRTLRRMEEAVTAPLARHGTSPPTNVTRLASSAVTKKPTATLHLIKSTPSAHHAHPAIEGESGSSRVKIPRIVIDPSSVRRKQPSESPLSKTPGPTFAPAYEMNTEPYTGPLETIHVAQQMGHEPLPSWVKVYHIGYSTPTRNDDEGSGESKMAAILHLRGERAPLVEEDFKGGASALVSKPSVAHISKAQKRARTGEGVVPGGQYAPYALDSRPYEGYLHTLSKMGDLERHSLPEHVAVYQQGNSFVAVDAGKKWISVVLKSRRSARAAEKRRGHGGKTRRHTADEGRGWAIGGGGGRVEVDGAKPSEPHKATAVLHLKRRPSAAEPRPAAPISDNSQLTAAVRQEEPIAHSTSVFIWRKRPQLTPSVAISTQRYEGPMELMRPQHLDSSAGAFPLRDYVHVYNSGTSYSFTATSAPSATAIATDVSASERRPLATLHLKSAPTHERDDVGRAVESPTRHAMSPISIASEGTKSEKSTALLHLRALSPSSSGADKENRPAVEARAAKRDYHYRPSTDPSMLAPYAGSSASLRKSGNALEDAPLGDYVHVYHPSGTMATTSTKKTVVHIEASKATKDPKAVSPTYMGVSQEAKPSALLHLRARMNKEDRPAMEARSVKLYRYMPSTDSNMLAPYAGPLASLQRDDNAPDLPLRDHVNVYHASGIMPATSPKKAVVHIEASKAAKDPKAVPQIEEAKPYALLHLHAFDPSSSSGEKEILSAIRVSVKRKYHYRPSTDPSMLASYAGPLASLRKSGSALEDAPLGDYVHVYHPSGTMPTTSPKKLVVHIEASKATKASKPASSLPTSTAYTGRLGRLALERPMPESDITTERVDIGGGSYHTVDDEMEVPSKRPAAVLHLKSRPTAAETVPSRASVKLHKHTPVDAYPQRTESYHGPLHQLDPSPQFEGCPLKVRVATYHPGYYHLHAGSSPQKRSSSVKQKQAAMLHLKSRKEEEGYVQKAATSEGSYHTADHEMEVSQRRPAAVLHLKSRPATGETVPKVAPVPVASSKHLTRPAIVPYPQRTEPYRGPLCQLNPSPQFEGCPLKVRVATYHPGYYHLHAGSSPQKRSSTVKQKAAAVLHLKSMPSGGAETDSKVEMAQPQSVKHLKRPAVAFYPLKSEPYGGPLHRLDKDLHFEECPLESRVATCHPGYHYSSIASETSPLKKGSSAKRMPGALLYPKSRKEEVSSVKKVDVGPRVEQVEEKSGSLKSRNAAILHLKKQPQRPDTLDYHLRYVGKEPYTGPLASVGPAVELDYEPISNRVSTIYRQPTPTAASPTSATAKEELSTVSPMKKAAAFLHLRQDSTEVGKSAIERTPTGYPHLIDPYAGKLHSTSPSKQVAHDPLPNRVCVYHPGYSHGARANTKKTTTVTIERRLHGEPESQDSSGRKALARLHLKSGGTVQDETGGRGEVADESPPVTQAGWKQPQLPQPSPLAHKPKAILHTHIVAIPSESRQSTQSPRGGRKSELPEGSEKATKSYSSWLWWSREEPGESSITIKTTPYAGPLSSMRPAGELREAPLAQRVTVSKVGEKKEALTLSDLKLASPKRAAVLHVKSSGISVPSKGVYVPSTNELMMRAGEGRVGIMAPAADLHKEPIEKHVSLYEQKPHFHALPKKADEVGKAAAVLHLKRQRDEGMNVSTTGVSKPLATAVEMGEADGQKSRPALMAVLHLKDSSAANGKELDKRRSVKAGYPSHSDQYTGEVLRLQRSDHDLPDSAIEKHLSMAPKQPALVRVEWEPDEGSEVETAKDGGKGTGVLHMRIRAPGDEKLGQAAFTAVSSASTTQILESKRVVVKRPIATLHLKRSQLDEDRAGGADSGLMSGSLEKRRKTEENDPSSDKPAARLYLKKQLPPPITTAHVEKAKGDERSLMFADYPLLSDLYVGEVASLHYRADPHKEPLEHYVATYQAAAYPTWAFHGKASSVAESMSSKAPSTSPHSPSASKPAALLHLKHSTEASTSVTIAKIGQAKGEALSSIYAGYPTRSDPYAGEVLPLHYRADPHKEPLDQHVSVYRVAVYPASRHRASQVGSSSRRRSAAEISKLPAAALHSSSSPSVSKPMALLHLRHSAELPPSKLAAYQPSEGRVKPMRREPRAGKTHWISSHFGSALRGRRRGRALATPIAQVARLEHVESTVRTSRVEMNLLNQPWVNEAEMEVELRREARIDYICEAFLVRRTRRFQPPALQSLSDDGAYDGPVFLPKSLFGKSSSGRGESGGPSTSATALTFSIHRPAGGQSAREQHAKAGKDNLTAATAAATTAVSHRSTKEEGRDESAAGKSAKQGAKKRGRRRKHKSAAAVALATKSTAQADENRESLSAHPSTSPESESSHATHGLTSAAGGITISSTSAVGSHQHPQQIQSPPPPPANTGAEMKEPAMSVDNQLQQSPSSSTIAAAGGGGPSFFSAIRRRLSQTMGVGLSKSDKKRAEKEAKLVEKQRQKEEKSRKKEKAKKAKKSGVDVSSTSSSSSSSPSDVEVHHVLTTSKHQQPPATAGGDAQRAGPPPKPARAAQMPQPSPQSQQKSAYQPQMNTMYNCDDSTTISTQSAGPYTPARDLSDGRVVREERLEQVYRIIGNGTRVPKVDPHDASLAGTMLRCIRESDHTPKVNMVVEDVVVTEKGPVPQAIKEVSLPHTTTHTWHEAMTGPETVTTEVDEHGNIIRRTVLKSEQVRHTVQTQSYQTYRVDENTAPVTDTQPASNGQDAVHSMHTHTAAYENSSPRAETTSKTTNAVDSSSTLGELVSSKAVTTGNRTVETLTYKKEKDGVMETHVEHRITIHSGDDVDHDEELSRAILEATNMNPNLNVEKVDFKRDG